jgi:hypothetical protein
MLLTFSMRDLFTVVDAPMGNNSIPNISQLLVLLQRQPRFLRDERLG